jgi:opacity protein-like surface antigen
MKRLIAMVFVMLCLTAAAQAVTAVYAEITQDATSWTLWLTETTNWTTVADLTASGASGFGIASFAIDVSGVATDAWKALPSDDVILEKSTNPHTALGTVGFPNGPGEATVDANGVAEAFAGQDTTVAAVLFRGFGVSAGSFVAPTGDQIRSGGSYSWPAPGIPGSNSPGVPVFAGDKAPGTAVSIVWGARAHANVLTDSTGQGAVQVDVLPEPATLALLVLGGLGALRRRR